MPELLLTTPFLKQKSPAKTLHWGIKAYFRNSKRGCQSITNKPLEIIPQVLQGTVTHRLCHVATEIIPREYGWSQSKHPFLCVTSLQFCWVLWLYRICLCKHRYAWAFDWMDSLGALWSSQQTEAKLLCLWQKHCRRLMVCLWTCHICDI